MRLIFIEGVSGVGKSTITQKICDKLSERGFSVNRWLEFDFPNPIDFYCTAYLKQDDYSDLGLGFVELNMNLPEYQTDRLDVARLLEIADKYGIYYTIHLDENLNPCDFNNKVAAAYTETVLQTIEAAKKLSVPVLNMHLHSGVWFTLPDKKVFLFDEYEQEYIRKLTTFRDACAAAVGDADIKICVENCGDFGDKPYLRKGLEV